MIIIYRGHDIGLAGQPTKSLAGLLEYYQVAPSYHPSKNSTDQIQKKDSQSAPIKAEHKEVAEEGVRIKRENNDDGGASGSGGKTRKTERVRVVIVLDD